MTESASLSRWQKWLLIYLGVVALSAGLLFGAQVLPASWFAGWVWWQRLALILVAGPFVVAVYVAVAATLEGAVHAAWLALRHYPLPTIVAVAVLASVVMVTRALLRPHEPSYAQPFAPADLLRLASPAVAGG